VNNSYGSRIPRGGRTPTEIILPELVAASKNARHEYFALRRPAQGGAALGVEPVATFFNPNAASTE
jgi:hypothetical protein